MNERQIDLLLSAYNKLQAVSDFEFFLSAAGDIIEALAFVPAGQDNRVDLLLGRREAVLPRRAEYGLSDALQLLQLQAEIQMTRRI
jgi:hypothetical protein